MSVTGFNQRRRELAAQQEAEAAARLKAQIQDQPVDIAELSYHELRGLAKERDIEDYYRMNTEELREALSAVGGDV